MPSQEDTAFPSDQCGSIAAFTALRLLGKEVGYPEIEESFHDTNQGSSLLDIQNELRDHGVSSEARRLTATELGEQSCPSILVLGTEGDQPDHLAHFVVYNGVTFVDGARHFVIADAPRSDYTMSASRLDQLWEGETLCIPSLTATRLPGFGTTAVTAALLALLVTLVTGRRKATP